MSTIHSSATALSQPRTVALFTRIRARVAVLAIISLLSPSVGPLAAAQAPAAQKPAAQTPAAQKPAQKPAAASATAPADPDGGWPRAYTTPSGAALVLYQPQIASWANQKLMTAYAAVSYAAKGAKQPGLGTIKIEAATSVAVDDRLVSFTDLKIVESNFPTLERDVVKTLVSEITASLPGRRAGDRTRPCARKHRSQPDRPEERGRRESRSADDLLQPDAGGARQHRR